MVNVTILYAPYEKWNFGVILHFSPFPHPIYNWVPLPIKLFWLTFFFLTWGHMDLSASFSAFIPNSHQSVLHIAVMVIIGNFLHFLESLISKLIYITVKVLIFFTVHSSSLNSHQHSHCIFYSPQCYMSEILTWLWSQCFSQNYFFFHLFYMPFPCFFSWET